jgi:PAS domain S-box-containing protein
MPLKYLQRYGLAILSIGVALGASLLLEHFHFRDAGFPLLLFAVAISSWYGGPGPAVLAVVLSTVGFYWFFVEPVRTIHIYWSEVPYFIIFAAFAVLLSWFSRLRRRVEEDLRERAALLDLTHDTVFVMDMAGVIQYWNRGAAERYGWAAEQAGGRVVHDLLKTVFPAPLEQIKAEVMRTGRWEGELVHTAKDGGQVVVASRWSLQRDQQGAPAAILETNNDITERKRAQEELQRSEAYLEEAQRLSHTGSWAFDLASGKYVYVSEECARIFELDAQPDLRTREAVSRYIHPEDWDRVNRDYEKALREKVDTSSEFRIVLPSGTAKHIRATRHPVLNEAGDVVKVVGTAVDITERKRAEEALRLSNAYNRSLIEASLDPLVTIGPDGKITDVNGATEAATGCSRKELIGTDFCEYFTEPAQARAGYEQVFREGTVRDYPLELRHRSGRVMSVLYHASVYRDESGRAIGVFAAARDITERKAADEALRSSETERRRAETALQEARAELERISRVTTMGALTASIAHEVNQPLAGVVTSANAGLNWLAANPPNLSKTREALERVRRDGTRAGEVIARIRGLLKRTPSAKALVSVNQIVNEVLALTAGKLRGDHIETALALGPSLPPVLGDAVQLQQVLLNLITNALEAMAEVANRPRTLRIQSSRGELEGKPAVVVAVSDTGTGFGSTDVARLFEAFHTTKPQGMGMGLWISRSIIEEYGGRLTAQANSGPGATFVLTIPAEQEAAV